jgi:tetratricopeptide (TPR) repeat protein
MRYVIMFLCIVAMAVSGWFMWRELTSNSLPETASLARNETRNGPDSSEAERRHSVDVTGVPPSPRPAATSDAGSSNPGQTKDAAQKTDTSSQDDMVHRILDDAVAAFNRGDFDDSLRGFEAALPYDNSALTGVGLSHYKLGEYRKAAGELKRSVVENGKEFEALKFLSLSHYKLDDLEESETYAAQALALRDDDELRSFYEKVRREKGAIKHEVDESNLHFKVVFDGYEHGSISRLILDILDSAYRDIGREFDSFPDRTITVVLYTQQDFFDVTRAPAWAGGLFDGKIRVPVRGADSVDRELLRTVLYHEYVHAMVHEIAQGVPRWVHEGLAEYLVPRGLNRTGQVIPLRLLDLSFSSNPRMALAAYQESYSAIARLVDRYSLYDIKQFLLAMGRGENMEQAFSDTFIISLDEFAKSWGKG